MEKETFMKILKSLSYDEMKKWNRGWIIKETFVQLSGEEYNNLDFDVRCIFDTLYYDLFLLLNDEQVSEINKRVKELNRKYDMNPKYVSVYKEENEVYISFDSSDMACVINFDLDDGRVSGNKKVNTNAKANEFIRELDEILKEYNSYYELDNYCFWKIWVN